MSATTRSATPNLAPSRSAVPVSPQTPARRDHSAGDPHTASPAAGTDPSPGDQGIHDAQAALVAGGAVHDALLRIAADTLDDTERVRTATQNRLRAWDQDGLPDGPERAQLAALLDALVSVEHQAELTLRRTLRGHPLGPWVARTVGIGEKQGARLIAAIGDPAWNAAAGRPRRGPDELWAYCGYHTLLAPGGENIAAKRQRGRKANWNADAKMRARLCAESCIKQTGEAKGRPTPTRAAPRRSVYRDTYDRSRERDAEAVHPHPCPQCGPAGHPAQPGSPLSDGHKHARALRKVAKAILKDLWRAATV